jgi:hypothetical protein
MGEKRNAYRRFVGKPEGKRPLGIPRCRWVNNIKMDKWILERQDRIVWIAIIWLRIGRALVNMVTNLRVA